MSWTRVGLSLTGTMAALSAVVAGATIWLLLTNPASLADAAQGDVSPLVRQLAQVLTDAARALLRYL